MSLMMKGTSMDGSFISKCIALFCLMCAFVGTEVDAIGCFVCSSFNGSNPLCEDTFNSTLIYAQSFSDLPIDPKSYSKTTKNIRHHPKNKSPVLDYFKNESQDGDESDGRIANYHHHCWAFKKNRQGLFPADHCIKIAGTRSDNPKISMIIRTCALDSGTLTSDTEIVRISHCGHFKFGGHQFTGCVQACDTDGCNGASSPTTYHHIFLVTGAIILKLLV
uniref:Protein quiver n=1 Tax=Rhabditophanes sp. KR3021 TaxID=114890 RepID=A0AC35TNM9_9BILA